MNKFWVCIVMFLFSLSIAGQHNSNINAILNHDTKTIEISQHLEYVNTATDTLSEIHLLDWANAFSDKETPLAKRFNENFRRAFRFSTESDRGNTTIHKITQDSTKTSDWHRLAMHPDVIVVPLQKALAPNETVALDFSYTIKIANERFTDYGFTKDGYNLRYWHLAPAQYTNTWNSYSHLYLNDFGADFCDYSVAFTHPFNLLFESNLKVNSDYVSDDIVTCYLSGRQISNIRIHLSSSLNFTERKIDDKIITTDIPTEDLTMSEQQEALTKVYSFIKEYFGVLPQEKLLLSYTDYKQQPLYGLNQLPEILRPFENKFQYEMVLLKQLSNQFNTHTLKTNLRTDQWMTDGIQIYIMIKYIEKYYPDSKLAGRLNKIIGLRWFHGAKLPFNDQYYLGVKNMSARFLQQSLTTPKDSLLKFNYNISNPYKSGMGLRYLESYISEDSLKNNLQDFIISHKLNYVSSNDFIKILKKSTPKNIDWFTDGFINSNQKEDITIKGIKRKKDSVYVYLKNNGKPLPVIISGLKKKKIQSQQWTPVIVDTLTLKFPKKDFDQFAIDYDELLPEVNRRNNYFKTKGIFNKKIQFRLLQDIEDPKYHQTFIIPIYDFNVYDGLLLGGNFFNKTLIRRNLNYSISPTFGLKSKKLLGSVGISYIQQLRDAGWFALSYGVSAQTQSYAEDLLFNRYTPSVRLSYRSKDLRKNISQSISARLVTVERERAPNVPLETPNYSVFNTRYNYNDTNLTRLLAFNLDFQQAKNFNKVSGIFNFRKLFLNNQQINFRIFAGSFITNNTTIEDDDFFNFGLDRPKDYLFDYSFFGRAEDGGLASQQFITAEGNFKSKLNTRFANEWLTTATLESSIWNWIFAYADGGFLKSKGENPIGVYDSGIKLNLLTDYFELFFPLQSSLGFEPSLDNYHQRIRFKASISIQSLISLFTREWY